MFEPVSTDTVVQAIIQNITHSLTTGELMPGDRLPPEPELAKQLQVSRTALREALKMLGGLGVLQAKRRGGTFVATSVSEPMLNPLIFGLIIEKGSKEELLELRILMEVDALELVIKKATDEDIARLEENLIEFEKNIDTGDYDALNNKDIEFHSLILETTRNPSFIRIGKTVMQLFEKPMAEAIKAVGAESVLSSHRNLLDAIKQRDLPKATELVTRSFQVTKEYF